ncbi:hypothetical protein HMN09_01055900 [Mycena chlorophos]|uniref:BTB domain-containing protein n=1 Tax=Mycena chlorophos TaxID=658473 RepID=A0A8H6VWJ6_MYCCL|nr:hypothetical protein HMN09_01055900 [Mycena chlorophos]
MANATQSDERPPKRARALSGFEEGAPAVRSTKYWLDDGNVILQVESTQFRLNKSTLSFYSPVFRDMFSLPLPPDEPLVENCPVVVLAGDRSEDWLYLLEVMFPPEYRPDKKPTITELAAVLRLSQKYDIANFRRGCLRRLNGEFPTSLTEFDKVFGDWTFMDPGNDDSISMFSQVINLAREIRLSSILPAAFYLLVHREV